jgi:hypothetical protein
MFVGVHYVVYRIPSVTSGRTQFCAIATGTGDTSALKFCGILPKKTSSGTLSTYTHLSPDISIMPFMTFLETLRIRIKIKDATQQVLVDAVVRGIEPVFS